MRPFVCLCVRLTFTRSVSCCFLIDKRRLCAGCCVVFRFEPSLGPGFFLLFFPDSSIASVPPPWLLAIPEILRVITLAATTFSFLFYVWQASMVFRSVRVQTSCRNTPRVTKNYLLLHKSQKTRLFLFSGLNFLSCSIRRPSFTQIVNCVSCLIFVFVFLYFFESFSFLCF